MNTKPHAICDSQGRPLDLFVTAGQVSDYIGARALLSICRMWNGCSGTGDMMLTGSEMR